MSDRNFTALITLEIVGAVRNTGRFPLDIVEGVVNGVFNEFKHGGQYGIDTLGRLPLVVKLVVELDPPEVTGP